MDRRPMSRNVQITAMFAGLLVLALCLWWWQAGGRLAPHRQAHPDDVTMPSAQEPRGDAGRQESRESQDRDAQREQITTGNATDNQDVDAATGALRIRVLYGDDKSPACGVRVHVREIRPVGPHPPGRVVQANPSGEIVVADLHPGPAWVSARRGMASERVEVVAGKETDVVLTLGLGIDIAGQVVDTDSVGVANATVLAGGWAGEDPTPIATTDADGWFAVRQIPTHSHLGARAKGHAPSPLWSVVSGAGSRVAVRIILPGVGGSVRGRVLDPDGKGVADAMVKIGTPPQFGRPITLPDGAQGMQTPCHEVTSDGEGRFLAEGLTPGTQPVEVAGGAFAPWSGSVAVVAHLTTPLVVRLGRGVAVEGTVRNEKGKPLGGVTLEHGRYRTAERRETRSEADGSYRLEGLPANKPITVKARSDKSGGASRELEGSPGETFRWDVMLSRGLVLKGTVFGRDGKPLPKASLQVFSGRFLRHGYSDENGRFEIIQCPKGPVLRLEVRHRGYEPLARVNVDAANSPLTLHLDWEGEPTARILGQVVDPDGKPVQDAVIYIRGGGGGVATPTAQGEIKIQNRRPGTYLLRIRAANYAVHLTEERRIGPGETWNLGRITLVRSGRLRVDLKLPQGRDKERLGLSIYLPDGRWHSGFATRERPLLSDPLEPGRYHLKVWGPEVFPQKIPFEIREGQEITLDVAPRFAPTCVLLFELPAGTEKVRRIEFSVTGPAGFRIDWERGRSVPYPFKQELGLVPGRYTVQAKSENGHRGRAEFEVESASASPQTVRVSMK